VTGWPCYHVLWQLPLAAASSTFLMMFLGKPHALLLGVILTLLIFWRHRANISRIRADTEPKIGKKPV
jgi:acyl phosphate:glycerol-3-phosphate acyltransferase